MKKEKTCYGWGGIVRKRSDDKPVRTKNMTSLCKKLLEVAITLSIATLVAPKASKTIDTKPGFVGVPDL